MWCTILNTYLKDSELVSTCMVCRRRYIHLSSIAGSPVVVVYIVNYFEWLFIVLGILSYQGCVPLGWSGSGLVIQDPSGSWCIKGTGESMTRVDSPVPLMHMIQTDLRTLIRIWITPKKRSPSVCYACTEMLIAETVNWNTQNRIR